MTSQMVKAKVIQIVIIIAALSLIVSIIGISLTVINNRYDVNADAAKELKFNFKSSGPQVGTGSMSPSKGTLYYGWTQKKGNTKCKYTWAYKQAKKSSYKTLKSKISFKKNGKWYGEYKIAKTNGKNKYNFKMNKVAGKKTKSEVIVDLMIL